MHRIACLVLAGLVLGTVADAGQIEGVTFPDQVTVGSATLTLNGMGVRVKKIAFIGINIYAAALYLPAKEADPAKVLAADEPKQLVMHFLYKEVGRDKLLEAWDEGFKKNAGAALAALKEPIATFDGYWSDMKKGDVAVLTYLPGQGTKVEIKGKEMGVIAGKEFAEALFAIWLGPKPPNENLKKGLLGR
ncbi:MAG TPA: chalcone isomerase family protein [Thermoanaerobaculaceae bacterium]|nr:chalcone isomerase family protein [Thermoanaerobaculaceae bacterium]HQU34018.1 chalcone isomerase family protein [Thermoanaerobaculaceae bacterium]